MNLKNSALIHLNLQVDYCLGGAMEVPNGNKILTIANQLFPLFDYNIAAIDWHPANHISFAGNHPWRHVGQTITIDGLTQELLPFHCVQNSFGAHFHPNLKKEKIIKTIQMGTAAKLDGYSCFFDADKRRETELDGYLQDQKINTLFFMGMPTEWGVKYSVLDALELEYQVIVVENGCSGWDKPEGEIKQANITMKKAGAIFIQSDKLLAQIKI